jgi:hypothetical protein
MKHTALSAEKPRLHRVPNCPGAHRVMLVMPPSMFDQVKELAQEDMRSTSAWIINLLRDHLIDLAHSAPAAPQSPSHSTSVERD